MTYDDYKDNYGAEVVMRVTCQYCGTQIYIRQNPEKKNNSSLLEHFKPLPEGWKIKNNIGWCCPHCVNELEFTT